MITYRFTIYGTHENKELARFVRFIEKKYEKIASEHLHITFFTILGEANLERETKLTEDQIERARFMLETEFSKHFSNVKITVSII